MIQTAAIEAFVDRIYAYAVRKTYTREEADELSQEILFTAVKELHKLRDEGCFEPWLWGVARNVERSFRRKMGRQRAMYSYNVPEDISCDETVAEELARSEELYDMLRAKIAMLSSMYRDIIILYYYDGLSTRQIADRLEIPEGTVTWRLSEARKKLKKECNNMEESALRPVKMKIDIYGNGNYDGVRIPFPNVYIEELAKLCGVPAYYVEERMENLVRHEAVTESAKGKYRTEFLIWTDEYGKYCQAIDRYLAGYRRLFPEHLGDTADRMCRSVFHDMYDVIVSYGQDKGELPVPPKGSVCDVLLEKK